MPAIYPAWLKTDLGCKKRHELKDLIVFEEQKSWKSLEEIGSITTRECGLGDHRECQRQGAPTIKDACCSRLLYSGSYVKVGTQINKNSHIQSHAWLKSNIWQCHTGNPELEFILQNEWESLKISMSAPLGKLCLIQPIEEKFQWELLVSGSWWVEAI